MDLQNISVFGLAGQKMQFLSERQKVLATNIANVNTPNYIAKDIMEPDFGNIMSSTLKMNTTDSKHMSLGQMNGVTAGKVYTPKPSNALTIDGNGVIVEQQLNEASKSKSEYSRMITIYKSYKSMLQTANTKINI